MIDDSEFGNFIHDEVSRVSKSQHEGTAPVPGIAARVQFAPLAPVPPEPIVNQTPTLAAAAEAAKVASATKRIRTLKSSADYVLGKLDLSECTVVIDMTHKLIETVGTTRKRLTNLNATAAAAVFEACSRCGVPRERITTAAAAGVKEKVLNKEVRQLKIDCPAELQLIGRSGSLEDSKRALARATQQGSDATAAKGRVAAAEARQKARSAKEHRIQLMNSLVEHARDEIRDSEGEKKLPFAVIHKTMHFVQKMEERDVTAGRKPRTVAAAALFLVARNDYDLWFSYAELARLIGVTGKAISDLVKLMENAQLSGAGAEQQQRATSVHSTPAGFAPSQIAQRGVAGQRQIHTSGSKSAHVARPVQYGNRTAVTVQFSGPNAPAPAPVGVASEPAARKRPVKRPRQGLEPAARSAPIPAPSPAPRQVPAARGWRILQGGLQRLLTLARLGMKRVASFGMSSGSSSDSDND